MSVPRLPHADAGGEAAELLTTPVNGTGRLRRVLEVACREARVTLKALTVLSDDPYRLDTDAGHRDGHRDGRWLAAHLRRLGYLNPDAIALGDYRRIHLRGVHYALVVTGDVVKPNGRLYVNDEENWLWLSEDCAKAARWLGYLPFQVIHDARNSPPVIHRRAATRPASFINVGIDVEVPDIAEVTPTIGVRGFEARQAFHFVLFGEKTSLEPHLRPIAERFGADLYLPSGEISDTLLFMMARDGAAAGRPMIVFVFADCDPSGVQMAVSMGRKLQALRDLLYPDLEFEVRPVALTVEQVREHDLPSTPLKSTEQRASKWRAAFGIEQTEIDALAEIRPDLLRRLAVTAIEPFYDSSLPGRVATARQDWRTRAQAALDAQLDPDLLDQLRAAAGEKLATLAAEIEEVNQQLATATDDLALDLPPFEVPEARPALGGKAPLITTAWDWATNSLNLLARKRY